MAAQNCTAVTVAHDNGERLESVLSSSLQVSSEARHGMRTVKEEERESEGRASRRERKRERERESGIAEARGEEEGFANFEL